LAFNSSRRFIIYCPSAAAIGFLLAAELALPTAVTPSWKARGRGILFTAVGIPISVVLFQIIKLAINPNDIRPYFAGTRPFDGPLGVALGALIAVSIADLFFYWFHRLQHAVPLLWRFHSVHHSVSELGAGSSYVHFGEGAVKIVLYSVPLAFVIPDQITGVLGFVVGLQMTYIHSANRLNFGPLRYLFVDNRMHRIHHSTDPSHYDRNFGVTVTIWDQLFGTAHFPKPGEWPTTGLRDRPEPQSVGEFVLQPFSLRRKLSHNPKLAQSHK
jgi:sterol desaturase/sphingolipid hydroxylase (fatty acid hydroxylase superfamily)